MASQKQAYEMTRADGDGAAPPTSPSSATPNYSLKRAKSTSLADVEVMKKAMAAAAGSPWVIDPTRDEWTQWWDLFMMAMLTVILFLTPYEVAFLEGGTIDGLFVVNRGFDVLFIIDLLINFFLAYQNGPDQGSTWVRSLPQIRSRYVRGWFCVDLFSVLPFWLVGILLQQQDDSDGGTDATTNGTLEEVGEVANILRAVRAVRLLRLIKLSKVLGMSRILKRYETQMDVTYASLALVKILFWVVAWSHLQACLWGLIPLFEPDDAETWLGDFCTGSLGQEIEDTSPWLKYTAALYFSVMTLTSIGYGAMLPPDSNATEKFWCVVLMLISSMMWVYTMGQMCAVATALDPDTATFHNRMDALNAFMRERGLDKSLRVKLRQFFHSSRTMAKLSGDADELLERMSPMLRGETALATAKVWLEKVWYLPQPSQHRPPPGGYADADAEAEAEADLLDEESFVAELAMVLRPLAFTRAERVPSGALYILQKGLVCRGWAFMGPGRVWGEDMIVAYPQLVQHTPPTTAMTYIEVLCLERDDLMRIAARYPAALKRIKSAARRMAMATIIKNAAIRRMVADAGGDETADITTLKGGRKTQPHAVHAGHAGHAHNEEAIRGAVRAELQAMLPELARAMLEAQEAAKRGGGSKAKASGGGGGGKSGQKSTPPKEAKQGWSPFKDLWA